MSGREKTGGYGCDNVLRDGRILNWQSFIDTKSCQFAGWIWKTEVLHERNSYLGKGKFNF